MKKLLLMFVAILSMATFARAEEAVFTMGSSSATTPMTVDGIKISFSKGSSSNATAWNANSKEIRFYYKNVLTVSANEDIIITEVALVIKSGSNNNGATVNTGNWDKNSTTWTGEANEVIITNGGTSGHLKITEIKVTYHSAIQDDRLDAGLAFPEATYSANLAGTFDAPALTNPNNLAVTYTSSNEAVATVGENGTVTLVAAGTTEITASTEGNDQYKPGSASYTLTVIDPNAPAYILASDNSQIYPGCTFIIVNSNKNKIMSYTANGKRMSALDVTITDNQILTLPATTAEVCYEVDADGKYLTIINNSVSGFFNTTGSGSLGLVDSYSNCTTVENFSIASDGTADVELGTTAPLIRYNASSNWFACYGANTSCDRICVFVKTIASIEPENVTPGENLTLKPNETLTITFPTQAGYQIWYKFTETASTPDTPETQIMRSQDFDNNGYELYTDGITVDKAGTLEYYTYQTSTRVRSALKTISIGSTTGLNEVIVEEGEAVYYNLQGVRVANPENGIFIRVQGGKAAKVIL